MEELQKDKLAILKDIGALTAEIANKSKELKEIGSDIQAAKEERIKQQGLKNTFIAAQDRDVAEKKKELADTQSQIAHLKSIEEEKIISLRSECSRLETQRASLEIKISSEENKLKELLSSTDKASKILESLNKEISVLNQDAIDTKNLVDKLILLSKDLDSKINTQKEIFQELFKKSGEIIKRQAELDSYHRELNIREKELKIKEEVVEDLYQASKTKFKKRK